MHKVSLSLFHYEFFSINLACGLTSGKGQIFQTFEKWGSIFRVEFDIIAKRVQWNTNILHLTTGEDSVSIPSVRAWGTQFVVECSGVGPLVRYGFEIDRKYHFVIEQTLEDGIVMSKVIVDGEVVYSQQNNYYNNYNNVIAYVSDPWKDPFDGCLDNLKFTPGSKYYCVVLLQYSIEPKFLIHWRQTSVKTLR